MPRLVVIAWILASVAPAYAQRPPATVFRGIPEIKISEGGTERLPESIPREKGVNLAVVISRIGDELFWASRENVPLVEIDFGGAFITYMAVNGSGYIRITRPSDKADAALAGGPEARFDYVEHLLVGLRSVTYYGRQAR